MRMLVTGPRGFVGARIMERYPDAVPAPSLRGLDADAVRRLVDVAEPDIIIHTAAMSDIGQCEKHPEESWHANVDLPLMLASTGVRCVMFSSDQVYSACPGTGPYTEEETCPGNLYAREKLEMEQQVLDRFPDAVMLRATWMYDMPIYGLQNRDNFLMQMLKRERMTFSFAQHRAVTYVREVADQILSAAQCQGGVYNFGSENPLCMFDTAECLRKALNRSMHFEDTGPRHALWMDCSKAENAGIHFSDTTEGFLKCLRDYGLMG